MKIASVGAHHFRLLGPLTVLHDGRDITPTAPKIRQVLAFLLARRNYLVQVTELIDELWGDRPPESALTTLQTYIYKLRKDVVDQNGLGRVHTRPSGYLLEIEEETIDAYDFDALSSAGRSALERDEPERASELLTRALGLWHGQALAGVVAGDILSAYVTRLEEERLRTLESRIEADMLLGHHQRLISELKMLTFTYSLHERFYSALMTALYRSGRRHEALEAYRRLRAVFTKELGLEPSPAVQRLHQSLLSADTGDADEPVDAAGPAAAPLTVVVERSYAPLPVMPAQLPPDLPDFTGRPATLAHVRRMITTEEEDRTTARVVSICGMPGVGKTTLALRAGHLERSRFPDGQLFADLRGATTRPASPSDVLAGFLRAAGFPEHQIPGADDAGERGKMWRTWTHNRRVLIVLDDADAAHQVMPLLPASPTCAVVITSRCGPQGVPGPRPIELGTMDVEEGVELLGRIIGEDRVKAENDHAEAIIELSGRLPLALRSVGTRLIANPTWSLRKLAARIASGVTPIDEFRFAEIDVRARYDSSYSQLGVGERRALRLLSLLPAQEFTVSTVAGLLGESLDTVEAQFSRLVGCHLLELSARRGRGDPRYRLHRLSRLYAREQPDDALEDIAGLRRPPA
ncbi:BTAD domain-containing putative transcriptional regulator [Micromonospora sp. RTGN7]|uniref:AfsR/SARP family transcriptional regulator n=1 Tax=Micromonospora sp. RTGN7 TaxID=3016526 RepID=UPI0029FF1279|nr:BTAD domain-containing putative transcriptional regulator [Micromonospora sp. RTGN7]